MNQQYVEMTSRQIRNAFDLPTYQNLEVFADEMLKQEEERLRKQEGNRASNEQEGDRLSKLEEERVRNEQEEDRLRKLEENRLRNKQEEDNLKKFEENRRMNEQEVDRLRKLEEDSVRKFDENGVRNEHEEKKNEEAVVLGARDEVVNDGEGTDQAEIVDAVEVDASVGDSVGDNVEQEADLGERKR